MITQHSYSGNLFESFFSQEVPEKKETKSPVQMIKVASNCVTCPYAGKVSADACNSCRHAAGILYQDGVAHIKCAYSKEDKMVKEASLVQGVHWANSVFPTQEKFDEAQSDIKSHIVEELKFAAHKAGVELAQSHFDDFVKTARNDKLRGRKLERAASKYVSKLQEKLVLPERQKNSGKLDDIFAAVTKNAKTIVSTMSSPEVGDNESAPCSYLGSKSNPNTIWNPNAIAKMGQTPTNDEIIRKSKEEQVKSKQAMKNSYWKALQEQLSSKDLISTARVHPIATEEKHGFNSRLPENAMGIFGDNKEFSNIPEKTSGEIIKEQNQKRAEKKSASNQEFQVTAAKNMESDNWLFR